MDKNILLTHQLPGKIIEILQNSKDYCFFISPYFKSWNILDRELEKAASDNKKVIFIFRDENNVRWDFSYLNKDYGFDLIFADRLHSKLYFNERELLISSMNLYDSSKENNYEVGYYFQNGVTARNFKTQVVDEDILKGNVFILKGRYFSELEKIQLERAEKERERNRLREEAKIKREHRFSGNRFQRYGTCIRCGQRIDFDIDHPLCFNCYNIWNQFGNIYYQERYCLKCGREASFYDNISYTNPICNSCK